MGGDPPFKETAHIGFVAIYFGTPVDVKEFLEGDP